MDDETGLQGSGRRGYAGLAARSEELLSSDMAPIAALWISASRAGRLVEAFTRDLLAAERIDNTVFSVLLVLWYTGQPYRATPADLAREVVVTQSGIARALQRAERDGAIRKVVDRADRRALIIELTPRGRRVVEKTMTTLLDRFDERLGGVDDATARRLAGAAQELAIAIDEEPSAVVLHG